MLSRYFSITGLILFDVPPFELIVCLGVCRLTISSKALRIRPNQSDLGIKCFSLTSHCFPERSFDAKSCFDWFLLKAALLHWGASLNYATCVFGNLRVVLWSRVLADQFLLLNQLIDPCAAANSWSTCVHASSPVCVCFLPPSSYGDWWDERLHKRWRQARVFTYASAFADSVERCVIQLGYLRIWVHRPGLRSVLVFKSSWIANLAIDPFAWIAMSKQVDPKTTRAIHVHAVMSDALSKQ